MTKFSMDGKSVCFIILSAFWIFLALQFGYYSFQSNTIIGNYVVGITSDMATGFRMNAFMGILVAFALWRFLKHKPFITLLVIACIGYLISFSYIDDALYAHPVINDKDYLSSRFYDGFAVAWRCFLSIAAVVAGWYASRKKIKKDEA